jgi:peptidoglycan/xylan/chitin deacetylase (PgdA/CDA1 family)
MQRAWQRRAAKWLARRLFTLPPGRSIVSFTFDDFPRSALFTGGAILERYGLAGTYYASMGLMKQMTPTGEIFDPEDLPRLLERGHELGCHTFDHCPAWETSPAAFEASVIRNAGALGQLLPGAAFRTLSYPISYPRPETKRQCARHFVCCRGGSQTFNTGTVDLNYLSAFFLEQSRDHPKAIKTVIDATVRAGGWLIFATHDVCDQPTQFGCTPGLFENIVHHAVKSGAEVLPVHRAWQVIESRNAKRR